MDRRAGRVRAFRRFASGVSASQPLRRLCDSERSNPPGCERGADPELALVLADPHVPNAERSGHVGTCEVARKAQRPEVLAREPGPRDGSGERRELAVLARWCGRGHRGRLGAHEPVPVSSVPVAVASFWATSASQPANQRRRSASASSSGGRSAISSNTGRTFPWSRERLRVGRYVTSRESSPPLPPRRSRFRLSGASVLIVIPGRDLRWPLYEKRIAAPNRAARSDVTFLGPLFLLRRTSLRIGLGIGNATHAPDPLTVRGPVEADSGPPLVASRTGPVPCLSQALVGRRLAWQ
jgi:hypothetical protein